MIFITYGIDYIAIQTDLLVYFLPNTVTSVPMCAKNSRNTSIRVHDFYIGKTKLPLSQLKAFPEQKMTDPNVVFLFSKKKM